MPIEFPPLDGTLPWGVLPSGRPGGQQRFSDLAIETALTLRLVFRLPLRQTEGFVRSILTVMRAGLDAPDHTTLSRRGQLLMSRCTTSRPRDRCISSSTVRAFRWLAKGSGRPRNTAAVAREAGRSSIWASTAPADRRACADRGDGRRRVRGHRSDWSCGRSRCQSHGGRGLRHGGLL